MPNLLRLLLDTHAFLWSASAPERFSKTTRALIEDSANSGFISAAVAWEIAIKHGLGKIQLPADPAIYVPARIRSLGFRALAITAEHALAVCALPKHHADPFDRILIAQAQVEGFTLVTADPKIRAYAVNTIPAD